MGMTILTREQRNRIKKLSTVISATEKKTTKCPFHRYKRRQSLHVLLSSATSSGGKDLVNRVAWPPRDHMQ